MTNVKHNGVPFERTLTSLFDDFFTEVPALLKTDVKHPNYRGHAPVNISETNEFYQIDVVAPGYEKPDFKINLDKNILSISAEQKAEESVEGHKSIRKEFHQRSFKRTFTIDHSIDTEHIEAKYVNGILKVTLNKKEKEKTASKDIQIQ